MSATYQQAKHLLGAMLNETEFRPTAPPVPWWRQVLRWIANRLHLQFHLSGADWRVLAWWIAGIIGSLFIAVSGLAIVRALLRKQTTVRTQGPRSEVREDELHVAERALSQGQYDVMLHCLMESCLKFAERQGWIRYLPFRTARQYQGQLNQVADSSFLHTYQGVVETAEAVLFAGKQLSVDEARSVYGQVRSLQVEESG